MNSKALAVLLIVSLLFPQQAFAKGLHFGIIEAIEEKLDQLQEKRAKEQITYTEATTGPDGKVVVHDDKYNLDVTVSIRDKATAEPIPGVQFEYLNSGTLILCVTKDDPNHSYYAGISVLPLSQIGGIEAALKPHPAVEPVTIAIGLFSVIMWVKSVYDLTQDPPTNIERIRVDRFVYKDTITGDIDDILDFVGSAPIFILVKGSKIFSIAHAAGPTLIKKGLALVGFDIHKKYKLTCYFYLLQTSPYRCYSIADIEEVEEPIPGASIDLDTNYWEETPDWPGGKYRLRIIVQAASGDVSSITISGPCIDTVTYSYSGGERIFMLDTKEPPRVGQSITFQIKYTDGSSKTTSKIIDGVFTETPVLLSPPDGSTVNTLTPTFEWRNLSIPVHHYSVQIDDTNHNRVYSKYDLPDGTTSHRIPSGYLNWATTYYWLVSASDANGNEALAAWDTFSTAGS